MHTIDLQTEHATEPLGLWTRAPRFSWRVSGDNARGIVTASEIEVTDEWAGKQVWSSGRIEMGGLALVPYAGEALRSATRYRWRVRVQVDQVWTPWAESWFETSLLDGDEWVAPFVEPAQASITPDGPRRVDGDWAPPLNTGTVEQRLHPVKYVRQDFETRSVPIRARLYASARGIYDVEINGSAVGDQLFAPGYESYGKSLSFQTYDVTELVSEGANAVGIRLADGWFGGRIDFTGSSAQYGDRLSAAWQLHLDYADGSEVVQSGSDARSCDDGPIRYADIFIGEKHDARRTLDGWSSPGFDASSWDAVTLTTTPRALVPFKGEPVRRTQELPVAQVLRTPAGEDVIDFGQVIAGRVRMHVRGNSGVEVVLEHSETLDRNGDYFTNIGGFNKDQTDIYILAGDEEGERWEPSFTFHGFRYVKVSGYPGPLRPEDFVAVVIGSDLVTTGGFACSDPALTRLHQNVMWSQRANFLAIPTDCPQRERVGWTGDLQVFAPSATRNADVQLFLERWLDNVRIDQETDGLIPVIVPSPPYMASLSEELADDPLLSIRAAAGWGDAIVLVPWVIYQRYGDDRVLRQNYDAMCRWVDRQIRVAESELPPRLRSHTLTPQQRARQGLLWNSERNFGDWNAPSVKVDDPSLEHMLVVAETTGEIIAAMFHCHALRVLADVADVLGFVADHDRYRQRETLVRDAFAGEYLDGSGGLWAPTQGTYVLALAFDLVPDDQREAAVARLVDLVHAADDHLDTGFLSVPYLLDVLWDNGHRDLARAVLGKRSAPSWLYAVDHGATTVWEEWDAIKANGDVSPASLNHYAFGCVDDWLFRRIAGIEPASPGFGEVHIQPDLEAHLEWAEAWQDTPHGRIQVRWERAAPRSRSVGVTVSLPLGVTGELHLPADHGVATQPLVAGTSTFHTEAAGVSL